MKLNSVQPSTLAMRRRIDKCPPPHFDGYGNRERWPATRADMGRPSRAEPRRARVIEVDDLELVLAQQAKSGSAASDELKILLSYYAGLRACEIASLTVANVCDARGDINDTIWIASNQSKGGRERTIPMHPKIRESMTRFLRRHPTLDYFAFSSRWGGAPKRQNAKAVAGWFRDTYRRAGLVGCSSHSGRRSFITQLARCANDALCSLHDVQRLAGHARLDTTQAYIEPSATVKTLVHSLGSLPASPRSNRPMSNY